MYSDNIELYLDLVLAYLLIIILLLVLNEISDITD